MKNEEDYKQKLKEVEEFFDFFDENIIFCEIQENAKVERFVRAKDYLYLSSRIKSIIKGENDNFKK